jgi:hypothetical protein
VCLLITLNHNEISKHTLPIILGWRLIPTHSYVFPSKYLTVCIPAQMPTKQPKNSTISYNEIIRVNLDISFNLKGRKYHHCSINILNVFYINYMVLQLHKWKQPPYNHVSEEMSELMPNLIEHISSYFNISSTKVIRNFNQAIQSRSTLQIKSSFLVIYIN